MNERFLRAKHWQLFLLTFGIPMIFQIIMMISMFASIGNNSQPNPTFMMNYFTAFPLMMLIFTGVFFGWFWAVAVGLQSKVPQDVTMKVTKFKVFLFIPLVYILFLLGFMATTMNGPFQYGTPPNPGMFGLIVPLHLFSMFCIFYCLYFVAKTFKTVELQRKVTFSDFAGEFFMIWFYPIGIWIIQPKINKMVGQ
ncbi:hypothetical protein [Ekhidna sp.]|uniref:hypothetical protein n=1 Tax=Ekhidna sp. TaxID=2608089 RepID=UPI003B50FA13